jgi:hypothetical protein
MTERLIVLGASNLARGLPLIVALEEARAGRPLEVFAADGYGRSYGGRSLALGRTLPGILECGLWEALARQPPSETRAIVADVGNDIVYGAENDRIRSWVEECLVRLRAMGASVVVGDLPVASLQRLSAWRFELFRRALVPSCRHSLAEVVGRAVELSAELRGLAASHGARFVSLPGEWYGFDPIHFRRRVRRQAWRTILGEDAAPGRRAWRGPRALADDIRIHAALPERRWLLGRVQEGAQPSVVLASGTTLWCY